MSEFEALRDAIPKMDAEFDSRKQVEQLEATVKKMADEHKDKMSEMRQTFETALERTNGFLVVTANHVEELQNRLKEQERLNRVRKEEMNDLHARILSWDEWKEVTSEWCNSLMALLFGDTVMSDAPEINALQGWIEQSPV
ncbi:hypothetical protein BU23DRAFT_570150 [Bimuria novae-zelandiae CBS 107.79]|uniref:Uncharacterized protein n=1 Tax=Bimuria novae-zelandiae CBS 107.79 TaxID=1447943 RepID=A0A6A5V2C2_9PLEO|nr:hypothetical protein BU23DRAFT_570150 [Bimuria novae-zelandiae CBS 107.79]